MAGIFDKLIAISPVLGVCLAIAFFLVRSGWLHIRVGKPRHVPVPKPAQSPTDSGRQRVRDFINIVDDEEIMGPEFWERKTDERIVHKFSNLAQERILPLIERNKSRLDQIEPRLGRVEEESDETRERAIRVEEKMDAFKDSLVEVKQALTVNADRVMTAIARIKGEH